MTVHSKLAQEIEDMSISAHASICLENIREGFFMVLNMLFAIVTGMMFVVANTSFILWNKSMTISDRVRMIKDPVTNDDYLMRYYMLLKERPDWFPINIFVHKFISSDMDKPHDHPWSYFTLILSGGYWEYIYTLDNEGKVMAMEKYWRKPGFYQYVDASHTHRIELESNKTCWTLVIPFVKKCNWKFLDDKGNDTRETVCIETDKANPIKDSGDGNYKADVVDFSSNLPEVMDNVDEGKSESENDDENDDASGEKEEPGSISTLTSIIFGTDKEGKQD